MTPMLTLTACLVLGAAEPADLPKALEAEPLPEWNARFAGKEGWIGGDCAYSVVLGPRRVLWLFGDSLLGTVKGTGRPGAVLVNNTVGVQAGRTSAAEVRFSSGKGGEGKPSAWATPADGKGWFWPQAGVRVGGRLFLFLTQVEKTKDPGAFGFKHVGQWLARIDNPDDDPAAWRLEQRPLPFTAFGPERIRSWGSAVLAEGDHLFVYGYEEQGKALERRGLTVARVPADRLSDFSAWRFRTADGWSEHPAEAVALANGLATEFSVSKRPDSKGFVAVYTENGLGDRIVGRFAAAPEGPWSNPVLLYRCPEMARDKGVFCYAAKAHPWAEALSDKPDARARESDKGLVISYCVNAWEFSRLFQDETVYRPRFVRVTGFRSSAGAGPGMIGPFRSTPAEVRAMPYRIPMCLLAGVLCLTASTAPARDKVPDPVRTILEKADSVELLSLEPRPNKEGKDTFHGYKVLGKVTLKGEELKKVVAAIEKGINDSDGSVAECFNPRHGFRATVDGKTLDLVMCFQCLSMQTYIDDKQGRVLTSDSPNATLNKILEAAKVPLSKD